MNGHRMPPRDHTNAWAAAIVVVIVGAVGSVAHGLAVAAVAAFVVIGSVIAVANGPGRPPRR